MKKNEEAKSWHANSLAVTNLSNFTLRKLSVSVNSMHKLVSLAA